MCSAINVTDDAWSQAQLGPKYDGLGLHSLSHQCHFHSCQQSSPPVRAAPHAFSWLPVVPSTGLGLHLESNEYQMAIRW